MRSIEREVLILSLNTVFGDLSDRELEDFEGNQWLFHTKAPTWTDDIEVSIDVLVLSASSDIIIRYNVR